MGGSGLLCSSNHRRIFPVRLESCGHKDQQMQKYFSLFELDYAQVSLQMSGSFETNTEYFSELCKRFHHSVSDSV